MTIFELLGVLALVFALVLLFVWSRYNKFVKLHYQVRTDLSDIDIQLKRRADLIEKLAKLVKQYAKHEEVTFSKVAEARSAIMKSESAKEAAKAENMLAETLKSLFAVVEDYPELKASENYQDLQRQLEKTEDFIAEYREEYNLAVQKYNTSIQTFPNLLVANLLGFYQEEFFSIKG